MAAPGQVVTLFAHGLPPSAGGRFRSGQAGSLPLPDNLAGISVEILQNNQTLRARLLAVRQENECQDGGGGGDVCLLTSIRVQIPFELMADPTYADAGKFTYAPQVQIRIVVDGQAGRSFALQPVPDNAHGVTSCDASWDTSTKSVCNRYVYHADGRLADENAPAKGGEIVVMYFYGLGRTTSEVPSGVASPPDAPLTEVMGHPRFMVSFQKDYVNALSSLPRMLMDFPARDAELTLAAFAGLTPGQVGLYQLNIRLPAVTSVYPCGSNAHSNAILNIWTLQGVESTSLCVQP